MSDLDRILWTRHHPYGATDHQLVEVGDAEAWPAQASDQKRLFAAFEAGMTTSYYGDESQWDGIYRSHQAGLVESIRAGGAPVLAAALRRACDNHLFYGFEDIHAEATERYRDEHARSAYAARCHDLLVRLTEALGLRPVENPEGGRWNENFAADTDALVADIEDVLGIPIGVPAVVSGYFGLKTARGVVTDRSLNALYSAHRIKQTVAHLESPSVVEIGGGLGHVARYAALLGIGDYTIVDLPLSGIAQGYFLLRTLGEGRVVLQAETDGPADSVVKLRSPDYFDSVEDRRVDLVFNIDGFTEYGRATAQHYLDQMWSMTSTFLSINHEANLYRVHELARTQGLDVLRFPYWLRNGYVEEIIRPG